MNTSALLRAEGLQRRYGHRLVVDVDTLELRAGEVLAILGPNGAGKSTLFRLLLRLERPDAGRILLDGRPLETLGALRRLAGVFQTPFLFSGTVQSNVEYGLAARGVPRAERVARVHAALAWLGLERLAHTPVRTLSGGEAQRVALARAFAVQPDVLLLDEPTANLDVTVRRRFREDLERLVRTHARAAILVTHDATDAFALADRVAVMQDGRVVQIAAPEELVLRPGTPFVAAFTGAELLLDGRVTENRDGLVHVDVAGGVVIAAAAADELPRLTPGAAAHVAYRPEDVLLAPADAASTTSARNRFRLRVVALSTAGALVRLRLEPPPGASGPALAALITRQSAQEFAVGAGSEVVAQLKAVALRAFPAS